MKWYMCIVGKQIKKVTVTKINILKFCKTGFKIKTVE